MTTAHLHSPSLATHALRDFLTHSGHVPLVLLILEALLAAPGYFGEVDPYLLVLAGAVQALSAAALGQRSGWAVFGANLVGPGVYTVTEVLAEGHIFFLAWHHLAYWGFAAAFATLQGLQCRAPLGRGGLVLLESVLRSAIPLVSYALFELQSQNGPASIAEFFADRAHVFLAIVLLLLGILLGVAEVGLRNSLARIHALTEQLRQYSEWALGKGILARAIHDTEALSLQHQDRAVVFLDVRGFTAWSERQSPEVVVTLLNRFYESAEATLGDIAPIKLKYTADEVMAVFVTAHDAVHAARAMLAGTQALLAHEGLAAGAGVHMGPVVEGVLGGHGSKAYDFIGDTVNTTQRLCDAAAPGEVLVSLAACQAAGLETNNPRAIAAKGKREPLLAVALAATDQAGAAN